ncbi:MAG TPA: hypothetical protein VHG91_07540, partial [Longimicrobium sp.]|nr:hypothetical protein [Longimicrobium sp.]
AHAQGRARAAQAVAFDSAVPAPALRARAIGPAVMGGRVSDVAYDPGDPYAFYVAFGTGGVFKTTDDGASFQAVFEREGAGAVGDIAVSPADPKVVWAGTGEDADRNDVGWGDGVYRSADGGATWKNVGLRDSRVIARVVAHPTDAGTAWVAAVGDLFKPSAGRGCFVTTDGGATWRKILAAPAPYDTRVGCGDIAVDPRDPRVIYAALYARRRTPWSFTYGTAVTDGRDLGGVFRSTDGGATWTKLTNGLPTLTGRIGLAVAASDPRVVYAQVQSDEEGVLRPILGVSKRGGIFRSADGGDTWTRVSAMNPRPMYFSQIRVDPRDPDRVYVPGFYLMGSADGGREWQQLGERVHEDHHALEVDARDSRRLLLGTDGGAYQSKDGGRRWEFLNRMPAAQLYRVNVDMGHPYRICGGMQDNGTWVGPSATRSADGIPNGAWTNVLFGDGMACFFDAREPDVVFTSAQVGTLVRVDLRGGAVRRNLRPEASEGFPAYRFNWSAPMLPSRHDPEVFYLAAQQLFRMTKRGEAYAPVSPDLTAQIAERMGAAGSEAERYGTIYALAESPLERGTLWAGTDDGKVWVTEDEGGRWTDLTATLPREVRGGYMTSLEAGHRDARVAYLAVDQHRTGDYRPHLFRTGDGGRTWTRITGNLPAEGPVKVVREHPDNPDVLFAGTEFGLFATVDGGRTWRAIGDLPTVAVDDLVLHPRELDLVVATHGRSVYILDDVRPLAGLTPEVRAKAVHLFPIRPATAFAPLPGWAERSGDGGYTGENPPAGVPITYWVGPGGGGAGRIVVTDAEGRPVANLNAPGTPGLNRVHWDLGVRAAFLQSTFALPPGEYTVTLTLGGASESQKVKVDVLPGLAPQP